MHCITIYNTSVFRQCVVTENNQEVTPLKVGLPDFISRVFQSKRLRASNQLGINNRQYKTRNTSNDSLATYFALTIKRPYVGQYYNNGLTVTILR